MSTPITYDIDTFPKASTGNKASTRSSQKSTSWFRRAFDRFAAARQAQVNGYIVNYLATMSDERLQDLGYTDEQIHDIRFKRRVPALNS